MNLASGARTSNMVPNEKAALRGLSKQILPRLKCGVAYVTYMHWQDLVIDSMICRLATVQKNVRADPNFLKLMCQS